MIDGFYISLDVTCSGDYVAARPSHYSASLGNWEPGECAHIENFKVFLGELEITNQLTKKQLSELESDYLIFLESSEGVA
jgi:hypothetical protein